MINIKNRPNKRKVLLIIKLVLILALGHMIVRTAVMPEQNRLRLTPNAVFASGNQAEVEPSVISDTPAPDYAAILERDLFGGRVSALNNMEFSPVDDQAIAAQSKDNRLGIALIGTVAGSPAVSRAIIKDLKNNVLGQYKTGDTILNARIESIEKDRVVLFHQGRRQILDLRTQEFIARQQAADRVNLKAKASKSIGVTPSPISLITFSDKLRNTAIMLPKAKVEPHAIKGEVEGLRISDLDDIEGAEDIGLRDGDVIRSINGHRLDSKQKAFQVAMKARSQAEMNIELERDEKIRKFSLPLE